MPFADLYGSVDGNRRETQVAWGLAMPFEIQQQKCESVGK